MRRTARHRWRASPRARPWFASAQLQFSADADNQPACHLYLLPHQFFGGTFIGTSGTASGTAVCAEAPIRAANVKNLRNGYLLPPGALNTMDQREAAAERERGNIF